MADDVAELVKTAEAWRDAYRSAAMQAANNRVYGRRLKQELTDLIWAVEAGNRTQMLSFAKMAREALESGEII